MKIVITGGAGFIGSHLAKAYLDAHHDVIVIDNLAYGPRQQQNIDARARFYHMDIRDHGLRKILQNERPDIVSHHVIQRYHSLQTLADADLNVRGLLNVLEGCIDAAVKKIIFASGGNDLYASSEHSPQPLNEESPLNPRHPQDISKLAGEWYIRYYTRQYRLKHTILRYADVYGETPKSDTHHPLSYFINTLCRQQQPILHLSDHEIRDHIFIDDVVRANLALLSKGENRTLHISSNQGYTLHQLYAMVAKLLHTNLEPVYLFPNSVQPASLVLDNAQARQQIDWEPEIPLTEGMRQAIRRLQPGSIAEEPETDKLKVVMAQTTLAHV